MYLCVAAFRLCESGGFGEVFLDAYLFFVLVLWQCLLESFVRCFPSNRLRWSLLYPFLVFVKIDVRILSRSAKENKTRFNIEKLGLNSTNNSIINYNQLLSFDRYTFLCLAHDVRVRRRV